MSIRQVLTPTERKQISQADRTYLQRQLKEHTILNKLLSKSVNQHLLHELQCLLDSKPIPRQKLGQCIRGQVSRLSDGVRYPCYTRKMTPEERVKYGLDKEVGQS